MNSLFSDCYVGNVQLFMSNNLAGFYIEALFSHKFKFCAIFVKPFSSCLMFWQTFVSLTNQIIVVN